jgi:hypothetical protein
MISTMRAWIPRKHGDKVGRAIVIVLRQGNKVGWALVASKAREEVGWSLLVVVLRPRKVRCLLVVASKARGGLGHHSCVECRGMR